MTYWTDLLHTRPEYKAVTDALRDTDYDKERLDPMSGCMGDMVMHTITYNVGDYEFAYRNISSEEGELVNETQMTLQGVTESLNQTGLNPGPILSKFAETYGLTIEAALLFCNKIVVGSFIRF